MCGRAYECLPQVMALKLKINIGITDKFLLDEKDFNTDPSKRMLIGEIILIPNKRQLFESSIFNGIITNTDVNNFIQCCVIQYLKNIDQSWLSQPE